MDTCEQVIEAAVQVVRGREQAAHGEEAIRNFIAGISNAFAEKPAAMEPPHRAEGPKSPRKDTKARRAVSRTTPVVEVVVNRKRGRPAGNALSMVAQILGRVERQGVKLTAGDFADIADPRYAAVVLGQLCKRGQITRVGRGEYRANGLEVGQQELPNDAVQEHTMAPEMPLPLSQDSVEINGVQE